MTTYQKIEPTALKIVKHYRTDITKHDKKMLQNYDGDFLYCLRETGSNLLKLQPDEKDVETLRDKKSQLNKLNFDIYLNGLVSDLTAWFTTYNTHFYIFKDGLLKETTKQTAIETIRQYFNNILNKIRA